MEPLQFELLLDTKFAPPAGAVKKGKARFIGRCPRKGCRIVKAKDCDCHSRTLGGFTSSIPDTTPLHDVCPEHRVPLRWDKVEGTYSASFKCDPRCTSATGKVCVCSCGGANHGAGWL